MSEFGGSFPPQGMRLGRIDGFYEVSGIEDPAVPQHWVPKPVQDYEALVLASMVAEEEPYDIIIGLARGGLATAQALAYSNGVKPLLTIQTDGYDEHNQPIFPPRITSVPDVSMIPPGQRILLADELVDRGGSLVVGSKWVWEYCDPSAVDTAVTYVKERDRELDPTHYVRKVQDVWLDFESQATTERRARRLEELEDYAREMTYAHGWLSLQEPDPTVIPELIAHTGYVVDGVSPNGDSQALVQ